MTISYKWLSDYLPVAIEPERLSRILTQVGLEVESMHDYEEVKGNLEGLVIGEVITAVKHPNADKLTITTVDLGQGQVKQIVCGAPNVAVGQKVVVAIPGTTIYPSEGQPLTMKVAKIRGEESNGMICAEDEIGMGTSHAGIMVLPADLKPGITATEYFKPYTDIIYEIGLTPNRMDAMSHWGVARDVCAYLSHHEKKDIRPKLPLNNGFKASSNAVAIKVEVENSVACRRYSGVGIANINIAPSPKWMQDRLKAIGVRPINNIVDITNYIQHETGQPLHAFDADEISGKKIIVRNLPEGTLFTTLDEKERKLSADDLMITDENGGLCIAGIFGGLKSGVTSKTRNIFLESAFFDPGVTRKSSFRHNLRTDAASRFEKGTDISSTVNVLKRAALLIQEIANGGIASDIVDVYPDPEHKKEIALKYHYLKKLSGKNYHPDALKRIFESLGFTILKEGMDEIRVAAPYHKPDISLPADLVEEIVRIDGLDNIEITSSVTMTPSLDEHAEKEMLREKISSALTGMGFNEIMTNSITRSAYFSEDEQQTMVKMLNSLNADLDILRNSLMETALEVVAHNLNHKNNRLRFFEFGKAYAKQGPGQYQESEKLCLVISGDQQQGWKKDQDRTDIYKLKGYVNAVLKLSGINAGPAITLEVPKLDNHFIYKVNDKVIAGAGMVKKKVLDKFGIRQPVYFAGLNWTYLLELVAKQTNKVTGLSRFPRVQRDLAMIVGNQLPWEAVQKSVQNIRLQKLQDVKLFDIFESEKLGKDKKSFAVNFTFGDDEKTLTDQEIDGWMKKIMTTLEKDLQAEIRKA